MVARCWLSAVAVLLALSHQTSCQDGTNFFYSPVERSFAQVQPPLFPNTRHQAYFERPEFGSVAQQQVYSGSGQGGLPSPNYNQNPSPFQLPTGRSQPPGQYYLNQADFAPVQKSRFRQAPPHNFQFVHPASTYRPDTSHIHSVAYQHDPSRPETFLGQITLNNPDTEFLPSNRFKNPQFDGNSLRNTGFKGNPVDDDPDSPNDDLFDNNRVTTYNPNRVNSKQRQTLKQTQTSRGRVNYYNQPGIDDAFSNESGFDQTLKIKSIPTTIPQVLSNSEQYKPTTIRPPHLAYNLHSNRVNPPPSQSRHPASTTEYKTLYELEPLLEDDIGAISYRELMKNNQRGSNDVEVIKSDKSRPEDLASSDSDKYDSNPSASSMNSDNISSKNIIRPIDSIGEKQTAVNSETEDHIPESEEKYNGTESFESEKTGLLTNYTANNKNNSTNNLPETEKEQDDQNEEVEYEYYDEPEGTGEPVHSTEQTAEIEEEYETEEDEVTSEETETKAPNHFDVVTLKPNHTMVKDDNFKEFVDTTSMDHTDSVESTESYTESPPIEIEHSTTETATILRQEVVSVVTTKSVVNGTISVPDVTFPPLSTKKLSSVAQSGITTTLKSETHAPESTSTPNTTENWVVVASVQTSRSVSGARFLPFPTVEQEETKQVLTDQDEETLSDEYSVTKNPRDEIEKSENNSTDISSTESISDKLDSIQSELSSSLLSGNFKRNDKNIAVITESSAETEPATTVSTPLQLFTVKSITTSLTTEKSAPEPLPVMIKKFSPHPRTSTTTTERPKRKPSYVTVKVDDLTGLLPAGYKPRTSFKDSRKKTLSTTTTTPSTTTTEIPSVIDISLNSTQGRSSGITNKNKVIIQSDLSALLPKDFNPAKEQIKLDDIIKTFKSDDISKFLPPGFKLNETSKLEDPPKSNTTNIPETATPISGLSPKNYTRTSMTTVKPKPTKFTTVADKVDISAFLPKGFKLDQSQDNEKEVIKKVQITDLSNLLPPGYNSSKKDGEVKESINKDEQSHDTDTTSTTVKPSSTGFKVVFPSRPGSKPSRKITTPKPSGGIGPGPGTLTPTIHKGWPVRASTEFTGWPSPSTTPFSIDKLLEAQRNATATTPHTELSTEATTRRSTTTTTTTPVPPPSTTPGICRHDCDIAATIKIVGGVKWVPELLDHHTDEWKQLAEEVKEELNSVYLKSDMLKKWYKGIRIDAFSKGSVLVDYFIELNDVAERLDTLDLKQLFHNSLAKAPPGSVVEEVPIPQEEQLFDPDAMVGDQPEEDRLQVEKKMSKTVDKSAGKLEVGKFVVDPVYTEFIVLPKRHEPAVGKAEEDAFLPQWGIAVIVIALASLLFVVIFGVTVLVNRQKSAKAKQPIPLSEDMLRELDKSHMGGYDDLHLKERELPYPPTKQRRLSTTFIEQLAYPGAGAAGDSWRSEWTPQLQQYMSHYTPDSGRGSQLYGTGGNPYGYSGSQLYGQTGGGGGGSQVYGYTGDYPHPRSHYSRRRSDYDSNF